MSDEGEQTNEHNASPPFSLKSLHVLALPPSLASNHVSFARCRRHPLRSPLTPDDYLSSGKAVIWQIWIWAAARWRSGGSKLRGEIARDEMERAEEAKGIEQRTAKEREDAEGGEGERGRFGRGRRGRE
ncbi:hypothetical protein Sjap_026385 [Stephania japonica]|uniref:Uncharacterized protein n=1 Tax=Stephania japonica TaxID=461633 RepID=A0AAP0EBC7_9MAGN